MIYDPLEDSFLLAEQVKKISKNKKVLDVGCGSGIQMEYAIKSGAKKVIGVDVDKKSLEFCREKGLKVLRSNLFSKVNAKFDLIIFNPPYLPEDLREDLKSKKITTGGKSGDEIIMRFLKSVRNYLSKEGIILMVVSSLTPLGQINKFLTENNMKKEVLSSEKFFMEKLEVWKIIHEKRKFKTNCFLIF